jgi:ATP-dependent Clp protease ATP-binding subunit ClpA
VLVDSRLVCLIFILFHSFKTQVIVIMTSNLGAHILSELPAEFLGSEPQVQDSIMEVVRSTLSPELLNRIDETVVFNRLQRENMARSPRLASNR